MPFPSRIAEASADPIRILYAAEWFTETATLMAHAETYLLITKTTGWGTDIYRDWLVATWHRLAESKT